ncbi:MAG: ATP synthase subunit I [Spongiibacteraceae bacterium]
MITIPWDVLLLGFVSGVAISALFFVGLNWGMRVALGSSKPTSVLLLSALCRIAILLGVGYLVTVFTASAWTAAGYAAGFFLVRFIAILWVGPAITPTLAQGEK